MYYFFQQALVFLISTCINLYFLAILLRLLFQYLSVDFRNPLFQFVAKATNPILSPIQKITPFPIQIHLACLTILIGLKSIEFLSLSILTKGFIPSLLGLIIWPIGASLSQIINLLIFAIITLTFLNWFGSKRHSPFIVLLTQITEPFMAPVRRFIPIHHAIDISPILTLITLKLVDILLAQPIVQLAEKLA